MNKQDVLARFDSSHCAPITVQDGEYIQGAYIEYVDMPAVIAALLELPNE